MFENLSDRLGGIFGKLRGRAKLTEADVDEAAREIRVALLEADVALPVVKDFIEQVKERAVGVELIKSVTPEQQFIKIVNDALIDFLGGNSPELAFGTPPVAYLMVGLQGAGKTTSTAKIARFLHDRHRRKVLMASLDVARPAAQEQLKQLGKQTGIATLEIIAGQNPVEITKRALETARKEGFDIVMLDTAGRLSIDETLMAEVKAVKDTANPVETLLVADAMTGQDAVQTAKAFDEKVGLTGLMLTRIDGDARGGAALSMKAVTGKPIKLLGTGEKWDAIELFHPDRIAGRILGMGDVVSLVEKAAEQVDQAQAEAMAAKFKKGQFDFNDLLQQMRQMQNMGGMSAMLKMLPGIGKMAGQLEAAGVDDKMIKRQEAIILSMTPKERAKPELLNASRKRRIAEGSGTSVQEINKLAKQQQQMQMVMKRMKKMGMGGMMKQMKSLMGDKDAALLDQAMDPDALAADMAENKADGGLGPNPFAPGGALAGPNPSPFAGGGLSMPNLGFGDGSPSGKRGVTKKIKKRKKK